MKEISLYVQGINLKVCLLLINITIYTMKKKLPGDLSSKQNHNIFQYSVRELTENFDDSGDPIFIETKSNHRFLINTE